MPSGAPHGAQPQHIGTLADGRQLVRMLCEAVPFEAEDGSQWAQIVPGGQFVEARDGRSFQVSDALSVAAASELPLLVDWEHSSEAWGGSTRAAGWGTTLKVQQDDVGEFPRAGMWCRISWTEDGAKDVKGEVYKYLSPVLLMDPETRDVQQIVSIALTNRPALRMQGLDAYRQKFSAQFGNLQQERVMDPKTVKQLFAALSLADGATDEQVLEALKAKTAEKPGPSAEAFTQLTNQFNAANAKIVELEGKIAESAKATFASEVKACLDQASKDGKVPPAARAGYEALCSTRDGFESFKSGILPHLVAIAGLAPESVKPKAKAEGYRAHLKGLGLTEDQITQALALPVNGQAVVED